MAVPQQWRQAVLVLVATLALLSIGSADARCAEGYRDCDSNVTNGCETNIFSDPGNCGDCRAACEEKYGYVSVCNEGKCRFVCAAGYADCNDSTEDGCETYIRGNVNHCGACGVVCKKQPGYFTSCQRGACSYTDYCFIMSCIRYFNTIITTCKAGKCNATCSPGYADCNQNLPEDGCEVNVYTDIFNCGECGKRCPDSSSVCSKGVCK